MRQNNRQRPIWASEGRRERPDGRLESAGSRLWLTGRRPGWLGDGGLARAGQQRLAAVRAVELRAGEKERGGRERREGEEIRVKP